AQQEPRERRLSAPALAHQRQRLSRPDMERDAADRLHVLTGPEEPSWPRRITLDQPFGPQQQRSRPVVALLTSGFIVLGTGRGGPSGDVRLCVARSPRRPPPSERARRRHFTGG